MDTLGEEYSSTVGSYQPPANFQPAPHNYGLFLYEQSAPIQPTAAQIATLGLLNANASLSLRDFVAMHRAALTSTHPVARTWANIQAWKGS